MKRLYLVVLLAIVCYGMFYLMIDFDSIFENASPCTPCVAGQNSSEIVLTVEANTSGWREAIQPKQSTVLREIDTGIRVDVIVAGLFGRQQEVDPEWFDSKDWGGGALIFAKAFPKNESVCAHTSTGKFVCTPRFQCVGKKSGLKTSKTTLAQCHNMGELWKALQLAHAVLKNQRDFHSNKDWFMFLDDDCKPCPRFGMKFAGLRHWMSVNGDAGRGVYMMRIGRGNSGLIFPWAAYEEIEDFMRSVMTTGVNGASRWRNDQRGYFAPDYLMQGVLMSQQKRGGVYAAYHELLLDHVPDHAAKQVTTQGWSEASLRSRAARSPQCGEMNLAETAGHDGIFFPSGCAAYAISPCDKPAPWEWKWDYGAAQGIAAEVYPVDMSKSAFVLGEVGASCADACRKKDNMKCDAHHRYLLNDCRTVARVFGLKDMRCTHWSFESAPIFLKDKVVLSPWVEQAEGVIAHEHHVEDRWCNAKGEKNGRRLCFCFA